MTLYEELTAAGITVGHHASDLYVPVTQKTREILKRHPQQYGSASVFTSEVDGGQWYDVPFSFDPWWTERLASK